MTFSAQTATPFSVGPNNSTAAEEGRAQSWFQSLCIGWKSRSLQPWHYLRNHDEDQRALV